MSFLPETSNQDLKPFIKIVWATLANAVTHSGSERTPNGRSAKVTGCFKSTPLKPGKGYSTLSLKLLTKVLNSPQSHRSAENDDILPWTNRVGSIDLTSNCSGDKGIIDVQI